LILDFSFAVGPIYIDQTVPKMQDVEMELSAEFNGWVNKGGRWKPTDCQARVKVRCWLTKPFISKIPARQNFRKPGALSI